MNSAPFSYASTGLCRCTLGSPGIAPSSTSSMLGCSAAVTDTLSPSQLKPAVIHRICTSDTGEALVMLLPFSAMEPSFSRRCRASDWKPSRTTHTTPPQAPDAWGHTLSYRSEKGGGLDRNRTSLSSDHRCFTGAWAPGLSNASDATPIAVACQTDSHNLSHQRLGPSFLSKSLATVHQTSHPALWFHQSPSASTPCRDAPPPPRRSPRHRAPARVPASAPAPHPPSPAQRPQPVSPHSRHTADRAPAPRTRPSPTPAP